MNKTKEARADSRRIIHSPPFIAGLVDYSKVHVVPAGGVPADPPDTRATVPLQPNEAVLLDVKKFKPVPAAGPT